MHRDAHIIRSTHRCSTRAHIGIHPHVYMLTLSYTLRQSNFPWRYHFWPNRYLILLSEVVDKLFDTSRAPIIRRQGVDEGGCDSSMQLQPLPPSCSRVVYGLAIHDKRLSYPASRNLQVQWIRLRSLKSIGLFSIENLSNNLLGLFYAKLEALMKTWNSSVSIDLSTTDTCVE